MLTKKKIEIIAYERERIVRWPVWVTCPVCNAASELLTARQAGALAKVEPQSIYRWLASGKAHGVKTAGGRHRVCRNSIFLRTS